MRRSSVCSVINEDLPMRVKGRLPDHAQDIYRKAFNNAWRQYADDPRQRRLRIESRGQR